MSEELNVNHRGSASSWAEPVNIDQQLVVPRDTFAPRQDAIAAKARRADLVLATDLDGTFLGGDDGERHRLYKALRMRRDSVLLVYVTGRALESIVPLLSDPLVPSPDIIIADVGATVVDGETLTAVQPIQSDIEARWPGTVAVLEQLDHWPSLVRQDVPQERRCSFEVDPADIDDGLRQRAHEIGCDILFSAGCYLDILPRGVDKGSTLRAVIAHYAIAEEKVVVAGDTLNDLALFDLGLEAICVGAAEPALVTAVAQREHVYCARAHGAGGIHEGLARLGYLPELEGPSLDRRPDGKAQLLMVYHRLPFAETMVDGQLVRQRHKSPNGIIPSLLRFFSDGRAGSWIAWSKQPRRDPDDFEPQVTVDENSYPNLHASRIALSDEDISLFYERFSKEAFWPIIFSFPSKAEFHQPHWDHYVDINRLFAKRTAEQADRGAVVWIHDYNLWMVPGFLRPNATRFADRVFSSHGLSRSGRVRAFALA
jgi:HAD superfamily hydrolase (TIGR01484 family)